MKREYALRNTASQARPDAARLPPAADPRRQLQPAAALLRLQRTHGNRFVQRTLAEPAIASGLVAPGVETAINAARGGGRTLDGSTRHRMQEALGVELSSVRVHTGEAAADLSDALGARAFTVGSDIFFGRGRYEPESSDGRALLAHELTHVLQQTAGPHAKLAVGEADDVYERQADAVARAVVALERAPRSERPPARTGLLPRPDHAGAALAVQRQQATTGARVAAGAAGGAVAGGALGALIGSVVPGVGTLVGAAVGAGVGAIAGGIAGYVAGLRVSFSRVRAASTPRSMGPDRIPPRVDTPVTVSVTGHDPAQPPIRISVAGNGGSNGTVTIDGAASQDVVAGRTVQLRGTSQTAPGNAGNLRLEAHQGGTLHARSNAFSVAAVPENWNVTLIGYINTADRAGIQVSNAWVSDSGDLADLDQVERSESVEPKSASGVFNMGPSNVSGYFPAIGGSLTDSHSTPKARATGPGVRVVQQTFKFKDARTGVNDVPARNCGYRITRTFAAGGAGPSGFQLTTVKAPGAGTANGITSTAGAGGANPGPQDV